MTIEKIQELDNEIKELYEACLEGDALNDVKSILRDKWNKIRQTEEILSAALQIIEPYERDKINFAAPSIIGLSLIDYENIDQIAYDVIIRKIYNNKILTERPNPLLTEYGYSYLITTLFNPKLNLSHSKENFLINQLHPVYNNQNHTNKGIEYALYWLYNHPNFKKETSNIFDNNDLYKLLENYDERIKLKRLTKLPF